MANRARRQRSASDMEESDVESPAKRVKRSTAKARPVTSESPSGPSTDLRTPHTVASEQDLDDGIETADEEMGSDEEGDGNDVADGEAEDLTQADPEVAMRLYSAERAARANQRQGASAGAGAIKSLNLVNFMCHHNLSITFAGKMNFLVGHNGSGKSAILTAVAVGLGGKTAATGRGSSVKDLIRRDAEKAIITLTLKNDGYGAYKPDLYPENIIIERALSRNGASTWKFRATREGKILATNKSELEGIVSAFSIDVDQPLTVLTQDQAKSFLQNATDPQLYQFFLRGTKLAEMADQYAKSRLDVASLVVQRKGHEEHIPELDEKVKELERKLRASEKLVEQRRKQELLRRTTAWAYVKKKEQERAAVQVKVDEFEDKMKVSGEELEAATAELEPTDRAIQEQDQAMQALEASQAPLDREKRATKHQLEDIEKELRTINDQITQEKRTIGEWEEDIAAEDKKIASIREGLNRGRDEAQIKLEESLRAHEERLATMKATRSKLAITIEERQAAVAKRETLFEEAKRDEGHSIQEVKRLESDLTQRRAQTTNKLLAFGLRIDLVLSEIEKEPRWYKAKPVGPLGQFVQLEEQAYALVLSAHLGQLLCGFAVQDPRDRNILMGILKRCWAQGYRPGYVPIQRRDFVSPLIMVNSSDAFDYSSGDYSRFGKTILSVLSFSDEYVKRVIINKATPEKTFLASDMHAANHEIARLRPLMGNAMMISVISADQYRQDGRPKGGQDGGPIQEWKGSPLFARNMESMIRELVDNIAQAKATDSGNQRKAAECRANLAQANKELAAAQLEFENLKKGIDKFDAKVVELQAKVNFVPSDEMEACVAARQDHMEKKRESELQLEKMQADKVKWEERKQMTKNKMQELEKKIEDIMPERRKKKAELEEMTVSRARIQGKIRHLETSRAKYAGQLDVARKRYDTAHEHVLDHVAKATNIAPERIDSDKDVTALITEMEALKDSIAAAEKRQGIDVDAVRESLAQHKGKVVLARGLVDQFTKLIDEIERRLDDRESWWEHMRGQYDIHTTTAFTYNMSKRGFHGAIRMQHDRQELSMSVQTSIQAQASQFSQAALWKKANLLSGGERSFATVSLLLALWDTAGGPLRCLDEWDVFLDHVNRKLAANMLITGALESDAKQYILITPQDTAGIEMSHPDCKIIRLSDPVRDQTRLPAGFTRG